MLSPAQVVFDLFSRGLNTYELSRRDIKTRLSAFPATHIEGAITQLKRRNILQSGKKQGTYALNGDARRPISDAASIDYTDFTSRGFKAAQAICERQKKADLKLFMEAVE